MGGAVDSNGYWPRSPIKVLAPRHPGYSQGDGCTVSFTSVHRRSRVSKWCAIHQLITSTVIARKVSNIAAVRGCHGGMACNSGDGNDSLQEALRGLNVELPMAVSLASDGACLQGASNRIPNWINELDAQVGA